MTLTRTLEQIRTVLPALEGRWEALQGGRTNRVWRVGTRVVKVYARSVASPLFPNDSAAEAKALLHFSPMGFAPNLIAQGKGWVVYDHVPGKAWQSGSAEVAVFLGRLHQAKPPPEGCRHLAGGSIALQAQAASLARITCLTVPAPSVPAIAPVAACPLHGDPVPGNIIRKPDGSLCLIDWQCPAMGDPAEDLAVFLSPAMQLVYRGVPLSRAEVGAFLNAYPDQAAVRRYLALKPLYHFRMAAHCLWRAARGARGYEQAARLELSQMQTDPC